MAITPDSTSKTPKGGAASAATNDSRLVWIDMEMTGLNPDGDRIIELAMVVTNSNLDVIAEADPAEHIARQHAERRRR